LKYLILSLLSLSVGCNDSTTEKTNKLNNTNNSHLTFAFCEAIQDWDTCNQAGCVANRATFDIVDIDGKCTKRLQSGNICLLGERLTSNNGEPEIYHKYLRNGGTIGFSSLNFRSIDGWTNINVYGDYCCRMDPEGCTETPWVDATDQWYPFEGLQE